MVELRQADCHPTELLGAEVAGLGKELLDVEGVQLEPCGRVLRGEALRLERLARPDPGYVARQGSRDPRDRLRTRVAGSLEERLGGVEQRGDVARAPGVGEREVARLSTRGD